LAARINLSIPEELKERMDKLTEVNWSRVAQEAFETKTNILELRSKDMNEEAGLERLRASRGNQAEIDHAEGFALGKGWAIDEADFEDLERVVRLHGGKDQVTAELVNWAICDNDQYSYSDAFDNENASNKKAEGFVAGASEVLKKL
jgi:hypothetical protein